MSRLLTMLLIGLFNVAWAHNGFNRVLWSEPFGAYTLIVLEDAHISPNPQQGGELQLVVQLSRGQGRDAPEATALQLRLERAGKPFYVGPLDYVGTSSSDGRTHFATYSLLRPLTQPGRYEGVLTFLGTSGVEARFALEARVTVPLNPLELLPSLFVLSLCFGGALLITFYKPSARPIAAPIKVKGTPHAS